MHEFNPSDYETLGHFAPWFTVAFFVYAAVIVWLAIKERR